jgi:hypothetical protein
MWQIYYNEFNFKNNIMLNLVLLKIVNGKFIIADGELKYIL